MKHKLPFCILLIFGLLTGYGCSTGENEGARAERLPADGPTDYDSTTHGALQVMSVEAEPADWFDVLKDGKRAFSGNPRMLNNTVELAPGSYVVDVNRTRRSVTIAAGKKTVLWTGALLVEGQPSTSFWYPMQGEERTLASNPPLLNRARALFPGTYTVFVDQGVVLGRKNLGEAEVTAGQKTILKYQS